MRKLDCLSVRLFERIQEFLDDGVLILVVKGSGEKFWIGFVDESLPRFCFVLWNDWEEKYVVGFVCVEISEGISEHDRLFRSVSVLECVFDDEGFVSFVLAGDETEIFD